MWSTHIIHKHHAPPPILICYLGNLSSVTYLKTCSIKEFFKPAAGLHLLQVTYIFNFS